MNLDGELRHGRHTLAVRVYYEDTDFTGIDAPQVTTLLAASLRTVEVASPLTEASPEFAG